MVRSFVFDQPDDQLIDEVVTCLIDGGLIVAPTETRYGLLVRADRDEDLKRMYDIKHRDLSLPTALFFADLATARRCAEVTPVAEALANAFLPGPLTLVLNSITDWTAPRVVDGKLGLRISTAPVIQRIMDRVDFPVSATSANVSGADDPATVDDAVQAFGEGVDIYLDAGRIDGPLSTVVDCSREPVRILRPGAIPGEKIDRVVRGAVS